MNKGSYPIDPTWIMRLLLDTMPMRVYWKDSDLCYVGCNNLFAADAGLSTPDEIAGKTDYDMPWKELADTYHADDCIVLDTGEPKLRYEESRVVYGGCIIQVQASKAPLRDEEGRVIGVMGTYEDVTDRKVAEEKLRNRESLYRTVFERSPFPVSLIRLTGEFVDVNERLLQIVGVSREEAIGHTPVDLGYIDMTALIAVIDAIKRSGGYLDGYAMNLRTAKGQSRYVLISTALVTLNDELLILILVNDITERRQAEESLFKSEEKYRELVQNANSIILRWGRDGTVHFLNEFGQTCFGFTEEEIVGRNVMGTIVPETETSGRSLEAMIEDITAHPEYHGTNTNENVRKNGERIWIAWTNKPVFDEHGEITEILSVGLDITARIRDQRALEESEGRYRSIFNSNVDAFLLFDTDGCIVDANARAAELYACSRAELIGLYSSDTAKLMFRRLFEESMDIGLGEWFQRESVQTRRDGTKFDGEIHGAKLQYGDKVRLLAIIFDVTERNKAITSMRLFTNVSQNMRSALLVFRLEDPEDDRTLRLTAINPAGISWLRMSEEEVVGQYIDDIFGNYHTERITHVLAEVVRTGLPFDVPDYEYAVAGLEPEHYSLRAFALPGEQVGVLGQCITSLIRAEEDKRRFYRKTIESATEGKLIICEREEIERLAGPPITVLEIGCREDVGAARSKITEIAKFEGMDASIIDDFILCVGEAATNAIKHANGGKVSVHRHEYALLVAVADDGAGIQAINLPDVALKRHYTTAVSLGMGYKAMISIADRVYLATGPNGTTVAIEMQLQPMAKVPAEITLPDTW